jgi:hypothetical protein
VNSPQQLHGSWQYGGSLCHSLQYTSPLQPLHGLQTRVKQSTSSQPAWQKPHFFTQHLCVQQPLPQHEPQPQGSQQLSQPQAGSQQLPQPHAGSQQPPQPQPSQSRQGHQGT